MKTVFLNPFLPTDLNEKVTSVSFKIGSFDYIAKHANVKTTEIDFDKRIIQINDALDSTASLRELVRAFFIIVAYELNLNAEFPSGKKAHLDDIAMAHLSFLFTHWWDDSTFDWEYNTDYPKSFKVGSVIYRVYNITEVSYQSTQGIQYGVSDHVLGLIYIILRDRSKDIPSSIRTQTFWHEYVHCLFVQANEDYANDIKNVSSLQVEFNNPVISSIDLTSAGQSLGNITLNGFITEVVPNSEDEGTVLSIINITPAKLNEIVAKINSARDASTTGDIKIAIFIKTTGTQDNLVILINVI